jgi:hypothetical protein
MDSYEFELIKETMPEIVTDLKALRELMITRVFSSYRQLSDPSFMSVVSCDSRQPLILLSEFLSDSMALIIKIRGSLNHALVPSYEDMVYHRERLAESSQEMWRDV